MKHRFTRTKKCHPQDVDTLTREMVSTLNADPAVERGIVGKVTLLDVAITALDRDVILVCCLFERERE